MRIKCPQCDAGYSISLKKIARPTIKAACHHCGAIMLIDRDSASVRLNSKTANEPSETSASSAEVEKHPDTIATSGSPNKDDDQKTAKTKASSSLSQQVSDAAHGKKSPRTQLVKYRMAHHNAKETRPANHSSSSEYPLLWDILAIVFILLTLAAGVWGGFWLVKKAEKSVQNQITLLGDRINSTKQSQTQKVCETFLRRNNNSYFRLGLGRDLKFTFIEENIQKEKGAATAQTVINVKGARGEKTVYFKMRQEKDKWQILQVASKQGQKEYKLLYPQTKPTKSKPRNKIKLAGSSKTKSTKTSPHSIDPQHHYKLKTTILNDELAEFVNKHTDMQSLDMTKCGLITDIRPLARLKHLKRLNMAWCVNLADITALTKLRELHDLSLKKCDAIVDLNPLKHLNRLTSLSLPPKIASGDLKRILPYLKKLEHLSMNSCYAITDISALAHLTNLKTLNMDHNQNVRDLEPLSTLEQLMKLQLTHSKVKDLRPLQHLTSLKILWLWNNKNISDLAPLATLKNLQSLSVNGCDKVSDITPLAGLEKLYYLGLSRLNKLKDISVLFELKRLKKLDLRKSKMIPQDQLVKLRQALPGIKVQGHDD